MSSDAGPITGAPRIWAGHARATWRLSERTRGPAALPFPGVQLAATPLAFYDSATVASGASGAGGDAAMTQAQGLPGAFASQRARSVIALRNGSFGLDESALMFERGDSLAWVRAETSNSRRGGVGGWDRLARHVWGTAAGFESGPQALSAAYSQHGGAARLAGGEQQSSSGESGRFDWRYRSAAREGGMAISRGHDFHESLDDALVYSRRDAQENRVEADARVRRGVSLWSAGLTLREARVDRSYDGAFRAAGRGVWGNLAWARPAGEGRLTMRLGVGERPHAGALHVTPGVDYVVASRGSEARVFIERVTESVWSDLAPGQSPFLQSTWTGGLSIGAGPMPGRPAIGGVQFRFGQTASRALVSRRPVDDLWLRQGFRADSGRFSFGLLSARGQYERGAFESEAEAFALLRDRSPLQSQVDPGIGFRARVGTHFTAFLGDLDVRFRMHIVGVGPRESEAAVPTRLPGYVSVGAGASVGLADAILTIDLLNLEDRRRAQVWIDHATGVEALGPGRMLRVLVTWRLLD